MSKFKCLNGETAARILEHLSCRGDAVLEELEKVTSASQQHIYRTIKELRNAHLIHIGGWSKGYARSEAIYSIGPGKDAPIPAHDMNGTVTSRAARRIAAFLVTCSATSACVAKELGINQRYANKLLLNLKNDCECHVGGFIANNYPIWVRGPGRDAKRRPRRTRSEDMKYRRAVLTKRYGREVMNKIMNAGARGITRIVVDGKTVYQRRSSSCSSR